MSAIDGAVNRLNNKYLIAIIVALILWGFLRRMI